MTAIGSDATIAEALTCGGQEFGQAVADVLLGAAEPGGRLPTTWPAAEADVPVRALERIEMVKSRA